MRFLIVSFILFFSLSVFSQNEGKKSIKELNQILSQQSKFIADCEKEIKDSQIKKFGRVLPKLAGECELDSGGCPISIVKPIYPDAARKLRISGVVKLEIILDESGKVVYAKAFSGNEIFRRNAEQAARLSLYNTKVVCEKAVWQKKFIVYNFIPD